MFGNKIQGYRNSKRMAVNGMVERLCKEEDVGYMDLWDSFWAHSSGNFRLAKCAKDSKFLLAF